jgi:hypothetical protein
MEWGYWRIIITHEAGRWWDITTEWIGLSAIFVMTFVVAFCVGWIVRDIDGCPAQYKIVVPEPKPASKPSILIRRVPTSKIDVRHQE